MCRIHNLGCGADQYPRMISVANQKGKYLAKKLNRIVKNKPSPEAFEFQNLGTLAYLGNWCDDPSHVVCHKLIT